MMSELLVTLALDLLVASLLAVTIYYCVKLNRRVRHLQDSKSELAQLIHQFDQSTQNATVSINEIHKASKRINANIQEKLDKAHYLADDLALMIDRANKTADGLESHTRGVASPAPPQHGRAASKAESTAREPGERGSAGAGSRSASSSQAEEAASARTVTAAASTPAQQRRRPPRTFRNDEDKVSAANGSETEGAASQKKGIEAMMNRISELRASGSTHKPGGDAPRQPSRRPGRSSTEQELMRALNQQESR